MTDAQRSALFVALNAALLRGVGQRWTGWEPWAMTVQSSSAGERYPMSIITGSMREWIGPRVIHEVSVEKLDVFNRDFEHTEGVKLNDIEDDKIGIYASMFEDMGIEASNLWGQLFTQALTKPGKWADGQAFYGVHKFGKVSIDNLVQGDLTAENYEAARARMMDFRKADGSPLGLIPDRIMVGASLEKTAKRLFKASLIAVNGVSESNVNEGDVEIDVNPYMTGKDWYLGCTRRGVKGIAVQKRKESPLIRWDKDSDTCVKDHNRADYGLHYRGNSAAVAPHLVIKGQAS